MNARDEHHISTTLLVDQTLREVFNAINDVHRCTIKIVEMVYDKHGVWLVTYNDVDTERKCRRRECHMKTSHVVIRSGGACQTRMNTTHDPGSKMWRGLQVH